LHADFLALYYRVMKVAGLNGGSAERGNSVVEFALMLPWLLLMFTGLFDFGFYAYALIAVENASRVAVLHCNANVSAASDQGGACSLATQELIGLPNITAASTGACTGDPVTVTTGYCDGQTACGAAGTSADGAPAAYVTVKYRVPPMFRLPIPGVTYITRAAEMRLRDTLP
jgi:Flp pilus assembly protein TadG